MRLGVLSQSRNRLIYIGIAVVLLILVRESLWYIPLLGFYGYYIYKNHFDLIILIVIVIVIYISRITLFHFNELENKSIYYVEVISNIKIDDYTSFLGKIDSHYILVYLDDNVDVEPGEVYGISGIIEKPISATIPNGFDYQHYLFSRNIKYSVFSDEYELVSKKISLRNISFQLDQYISRNCPKSKGYIKTFILANQSDIDDVLLKDIKNIGISHLFSVSGLHIALIVLVLQSMLFKMKMSKKRTENIIIGILLIYLLITNYAPSITRATLMYIFLVINKRCNIKLSSLDIISIVFVILLIKRPYYYYNVGFVLSFLVTTSLILGNGLLQYPSKIKQLFSISLLAFFITLPIVLNLNYQINFLSLIFNVIFLLYVSYIILPLGYITFVFPFIDSFYHLFIQLFEFSVTLASRIHFLEFSMYFSNPIFYVVYYVIVIKILILKENKMSVKYAVCSLFLLLIIVYFTPFFRMTQDIVFLDVDGDSTLIIDRFNKCNILIDTGEVDDYDGVVHYLKSRNIKRIDYVFISHYHSDHYGEIEDILSQFHIINLITNENVTIYHNQLTSCGDIDFYIYDLSYNDENENNNSIILSVFLAKKHYLFVGDSETEREQEFLSKYDITVDYLKVGHHGSNTSSTVDFLSVIKPKNAIISVGRNNTFGHPNQEIIDRYQALNIKLSRTDLDGTIMIRYFFTKEYKRVHRPW